MTRAEKEREARVATELWRLYNGLPPEDPSFRTKDSLGNDILNIPEIYKKVDALYGVSSTGSDLPGIDFDVKPKNPKKTKVGPWICP
jgi:hypothetical protein